MFDNVNEHGFSITKCSNSSKEPSLWLLLVHLVMQHSPPQLLLQSSQLCRLPLLRLYT